MIRHDMPTSMPSPGGMFAQRPTASVERSLIDLSHKRWTTFDGGQLVPVANLEVVPGDTLRISHAHLLRLNTPIKALMHNSYVDLHWWFVPLRLLWRNAAKFFGEQANPTDSVDYVTPKVDFTASTPVEAGSLYHRLRFPYGYTNAAHPSQRWPHNFYARAYNLIWNKNYRDQNLQDSLVFDDDDGPDNPDDYTVVMRGKRHDYFTSALPFLQKGPAVTLPLGTSAPVAVDLPEAYLQEVRIFDGVPTDTTLVANPYATGPQAQLLGVAAGSGATTTQWPAGVHLPADSLTGTADLTAATAILLNTFRQFAAMQQYLEKNARGGTYYPEVVYNHFGVTNPDFRLQRPEFLGGSSHPVIVHPVEQMSASVTGSPQGNLAAFGTSTGQAGFTHSFTEHGVVLCLASVRADLVYNQGLPREMLRNTRFDYYWPLFAHLGEQPVYNVELFVDGDPAVDFAAFGYQMRYGEYRYMPSYADGLMDPNVPTSIGSVWTLIQSFAATPELNDEFIEVQDPWDRVVAVPSEPHFLGQFEFTIHATRPMPVDVSPGLTRI